MSDDVEKFPENRLLGALMGSGALSGALEPVSMRRGDVLVESGPAAGTVYFPCSGLVSLVVTMPDGAVADAAIVGREGAVGHPFLADFETAPIRAVVQIEGDAARLSGEALLAAAQTDELLREVLGKFARAFVAQALQMVACNALHGLEERLCTWLLQAADRVDGDVALTHEFLAHMVGASRPSISLAARTIQGAGLIRYRRGHIEILDRQGLEDCACDCYGAIRQAYSELLPLTYKPAA